MSEPNGRIKVSIAQLIGWGVLLATILGQWYTTTGKIELLRQEFGFYKDAQRREQDLVWKAVGEVQAAEARRATEKPRR